MGIAGFSSLAGCAQTPQISATFLQLWPYHAAIKRSEWRERFTLLHKLGYREIIIQWVSKEGGTENWQFPEASLAIVFDEAERLGIGLQIGLPHDDRWRTVLKAPGGTDLQAFFEATFRRCDAYMAGSPWSQRSGFRGWYIPYEIEQHSWSDPRKQHALIQWLGLLTRSAFEHSGIQSAISTYFSLLKSQQTLEGLWAAISDQLSITPMIQDGVGVAGLRNYRALEPLRMLLLKREIAFDLIIEIFQEQPAGQTDGSTFNAHSASFHRVKKQLDIADGYGAQRIVAFAADPWLTGSTPQAKQLLADWQAAKRYWP